MASLAQAQAHRARQDLMIRRGLRIGSLVLILGAWEFAGRTSEHILFPPISSVMAALWDLMLSGELPRAFIISNQALVLGLGFALAFGIPFGILLGRIPALDRLFGIYIDILLVTPMVAMMPVVIVALGIGLTSRVVIVFLFCVVTLIANVRTGARSVDPRYIEMAHAFGVRGLRLWMKVIVPGMMPALASGLRLSLSRAVVGMVIVELSLVAVGLGGLVMNARAIFHADVVFAGVLVIAAEGVFLIQVARWVERRVVPRGMHGAGI